MSSCSLWCYKSCQIQPDCADYNWRAKDYCFKAEDSFHGIFDFPEEPKHQVTQVGKPLKISPFIQKGDFTQAVQLSKVFLQEKAAEKAKEEEKKEEVAAKEGEKAAEAPASLVHC